MGYRDIHAHFIYGVDDGAKTAEDMRGMLDEAYRRGVTELYATSHSTPGIRKFPEEMYLAHLEEARAYCAERGYEMRLQSGTEILYTPAMRNYMERRPLRTMGDSDFVLIEFVPDVKISEIEDAVSMAEDAGYVPILAHVERYACLYSGRRIHRLKKEHEVRCQVNCGTVLGGMGFLRTGRIRRWFADGVIDYVATDMHDLKARRCRMDEAVRALEERYGREYARRLTGAGEPLR